MASLTKRTVILIICRVANFFIMLLSPMLLVRIFDVHEVGQYAEFMLYATLISGLMEFTMNTSLIYFIPKYPDRERQSVTHTVLFTGTVSTVGIAVVYLLKGLILARTSFNFVTPLLLFLFFNLNFEFFENYWLGKKRTDYVLLYSSSRIVVRTAALLTAAYVTGSVMVVIYTLTILEIVKSAFVCVMFRKILTKSIDRGLLKEQLRFILPLGTAVAINVVNNQLANLVISIKMGVDRLAFYRIGSQQVPIIGIVQSSIMDVLFPEMTQRGDTERLSLWQRANIVFCFIAFPVYVVFFFYATVFIGTLFTTQYLAAVPLFRIYLGMMLLSCFDTGAPLRSINQNKYFILGGLSSLVVNIGLILLLFKSVGFVSPAVARVLGAFVGSAYCGSIILRFYDVNVRTIFLWKKVGIIILSAAIALPVLAVSRWVDINPVLKAVSFSTVYLIVYYLAMRRFKIDEVEILVGKVASRLRRA